MRAVASKGGGPGSRWHLYRYYDRLLHNPKVNTHDTYDMEHLRYGVSDAEDCHRGCQHREAHRGNSRGVRSDSAIERRRELAKTKRAQGRRDFRMWKSGCKDATRRVPGGPHPLPPAYPKPTSTVRLLKQLNPCRARSLRHAPHQSRDINSKLSFPLPTGTQVKIATWNVEGLQEVAKYDQLLLFARQQGIDIIMAQETRATSSHTFTKHGWEILHSGHPQARYHGVGFFVSPKMRQHVNDFKPHSPRICEITLNTRPRKITLLNVYAPSQVEDAEMDRQRKSAFWTDLNELIVAHDNLDHLVLAGDLNSRLDAGIDDEEAHIGSAVVGQRQSIQDDSRDNAIYLYDTLQAHSLILPQTFTKLSFSKRCTYKEMGCEDHLLKGTSVKDWTALDYVAVPPRLRDVLTIYGSTFQQLINTRHLPLSFGIKTHFLPSVASTAPPKKDFTDLTLFSEKVETTLLKETNNSYNLPPKCPNHYVAYTDGSCPNNKVVSFNNPAGWGFAVTLVDTDPTKHPPPSSTWIMGFGSVKSNPFAVEGPLPGSNNTGELKALIELFDFLLYYSGYPPGSSLTIYTDSSYAKNLLLGSSLPATHPQLVALAQQYFAALRSTFYVLLLSVPAHQGVPGNEIADRLAKKGVTESCKIGRFSFSPVASLSPPEFTFNFEEWSSKTVDKQDSFLTEILTSSLSLIPEIPISAKKPWISKSTLDLIDRFQKTKYDDVSEVKKARKQIKKSARKDKKSFVESCLHSDFHGSSVHQWQHVKSVRAPFQPRAAGLLDQRNRVVSKTRRAETFADYLSSKIWYSAGDAPVPVTTGLPPSDSISAPFSMQNLNAALRKLKKSKAPGPNGLVSEIYKHAPFILKSFMLEHYNQCLDSATVPDSWMLSEVVMIVKNHAKDTRLMSNYRPISLTNISYKIFASMIQTRLEYYLDARIRPTQFGFRKNHSTSQPIHVLRRLVEVFERQTSSFHALFLDWEKAFDSVTFTAIRSSLIFMGVPERMINVIMALYRAPSFKVRDSGVTSDLQLQTKGLRQGCPLSPYLFSFVLTHLFYDVESQYAEQYGEISGVFYTPSPLWDLEYADDTVLLSSSADQLNRLLHLLQQEGRLRGLQLNKDKCEHMRLNTDRRIYFQPNDSFPCDCLYCQGSLSSLRPVSLSNEVKYLGAYIDTTSSNNKHLRYRISQAIAASKSLRPLTGHSALPPSWKLRVYKTVIQSILLYAMESATLSPSQLIHLDSIHYKTLRRIFKVKSSFYHRVLEPSEAHCSNQYLHDLAFRTSKTIPPSRLYSQNRLKLLGHLLRHSASLEAQSTFAHSHSYRRTFGSNRPGRPRTHWAASCLTEAKLRSEYVESDAPPSHLDLGHSFFGIPTQTDIIRAHGGSSLVYLDNTQLYRTLLPLSQQRDRWRVLIHKP